MLAAGRGERFAASGGQGHKLAALLAGRPVLDHVLQAVQDSGLPFHVLRPDVSRPGMGDTLAAGVRATADAPGWLILPADLPLVRASTLRAIALAPPGAVVVPVYRGQRGHPVRFSVDCRAALLALSGPIGAAAIVRAQAAAGGLALMPVDDEGTVTDIDTLDDLRRAEALLARRSGA